MTRRINIAKALETMINNIQGFDFKTVDRCVANPWEVDNLPGAFIYPRVESRHDAQDDQIGKALTIAIAIIVEAAGNGNLHDAVEAAVGPVEAVIENDPSLGGTVEQALIDDVQFEIVELTAPRAGVYLFLDCRYQRTRGTP